MRSPEGVFPLVIRQVVVSRDEVQGYLQVFCCQVRGPCIFPDGILVTSCWTTGINCLDLFEGLLLHFRCPFSC